MISEKIKISALSLAAAVLLAIPFSYFAAAQESADSSLEQLSEEDLQKLESEIDLIISSPSAIDSASSKNDFPVDLVWKANTYVPYDYKGKALPGVETMVTVHAIANTENPQNLKYTWIVEDSSSYGREGPNLSGTGRDTFGFVTQRIPEFKHEITVTVQNTDTGKMATAMLEIQTVLPEINLYVLNNENYNNLAPETIRISKNAESGLMAKVFYLNSKSVNDMDFIWKLDGVKQENSESKPYIIPITIASRTEVGTYFQLRSDVINKKLNQNLYERANKTTEIRVVK